jgi:hypothetical protein
MGMIRLEAIVVLCFLGLAGAAAAQSSAPARQAGSMSGVQSNPLYEEAMGIRQKWLAVVPPASRQKLETASRIFLKLIAARGVVPESELFAMAVAEAKSAFNPAAGDVDAAALLVLTQAAWETDAGIRESPSKASSGQTRVSKVDALTIKQGLYTTISNVLKTKHDTAKNSINNVR